MKKSQLDSLIRRNTLVRISELKNESLTEYLIDNASGDIPLVKNLCTRVAAPLADEIDSLCETLGMTKRAFCESAFIEAVNRTKEIMDEEGFHDAVSEVLSEDQGELKL